MTGKLFLYRNNERIIASDGLVIYNKCLNIESIKAQIRDLNSKRVNFPHKIADGFRLCDARLNETSKLIKL